LRSCATATCDIQMKFSPRLFALILPLLIVIAWSLITARGWVDPLILPAPTAVLSALGKLLTTGGLTQDLLRTTLRVLAALGIALAVGVPCGLWLGYNRRFYEAIEGPLHALRSLPAVALFPLFLIVIGVGEWSIVALACYNSVLVILISTVAGASQAHPRRLQMARTLGLSTRELITDVLFWEALPSILTGIRVAVGYGLALVIAVEMFIGVSQAGLGRKIFDYQSAYRIPETYAAILLTGALGVLLNLLVGLLEKRLLHWLPSASRSDNQ